MGFYPSKRFTEHYPASDSYLIPRLRAQFKRSVAVWKAKQGISEHFSHLQVSSAVRTRNGPDTSNIYAASINSHVLVYQPEKVLWEGPYTLLDMQRETNTVLLPPPTGPSNFWSTVVKRFIPDEAPEDPKPLTKHPAEIMFTIYSDDDSEYSRLSSDDNSLTICLVVFSLSRIPQSNDGQKYASFCQKKTDGLFERDLFSISNKKNPEELRIYRFRFFDHVKHKGTPSAFEKSRLVDQRFNDEHCFLTDAPTVQRASQRLLLSLAICDNSVKVISRDFPKTYVQSETTPLRPSLSNHPRFLDFRMTFYSK